MTRWKGWGAGPAGAGSQGPSRAFLAALLVGCAVVTALLMRDGRLAAAAATALGGLYFALRFLGVLGSRR